MVKLAVRRQPRVDLLRRDIVGRAHNHARLRQRGRVQRLGDAKIGQQRFVALVEQHVARFDITVNNAALVSRVESIRKLAGKPNNAIGRQPLLTLQQLGQRRSRQQLHGQEKEAFGVAHIVNGRDMRVIQLRGGDCFAAKSLHDIVVGKVLRIQHLERYMALQAGIKGAINRGHPTAANQRLDAIPAQLFVDQVVQAHSSPLNSRRRWRISAKGWATSIR